MRELKFRAWDKTDKRMIIDTQDFIPLMVTNKGVLRLNPCHKENFWEVIDTNRFELMQYTGFKDIHGNEIYEGDILISENNQKYIVIWHEAGWQIEWCINNTKCYMYDGFAKATHIGGNIYENPELLEK